jgi:hypothetical protein
MFHRNVYEQAEKAMLLAREHKLDAEIDTLRYNGYRIGRMRYDNPLDFTVAILTAFDKVGLKVPDEVRKRPDPMYVEEQTWDQLKAARSKNLGVRS